MKSYITDLYLVNQDFLQLLGRKQKQAEVSKEAEKEFEVLHNLYEVVLNILQRADIECQTEKMRAITEHTMAKILEAELRQVYNELYKRGQSEILADVISKTPILSKRELEQPIILK